MRLTVLYDAHCGLCRWARDWLARQPAYLTLEFVAAGSAEAANRYPQLDPIQTLHELTVVSDTGGVYRGPRGWLMCFYALREYREWALRCASPLLWHVFRAGVWLAGKLRRRAPCTGSCGVQQGGFR